jgi:hypothetical protein
MTDSQSADSGPPTGPRGMWIAITAVIVLFMAGVIVFAVIEATR